MSVFVDSPGLTYEVSEAAVVGKITKQQQQQQPQNNSNLMYFPVYDVTFMKRELNGPVHVTCAMESSTSHVWFTIIKIRGNVYIFFNIQLILFTIFKDINLHCSFRSLQIKALYLMASLVYSCANS